MEKEKVKANPKKNTSGKNEYSINFKPDGFKFLSILTQNQG